MQDNKKWYIKLFIILFSLSVSVTVIPCGIINTYGLFGEVTTFTVTAEKDNLSVRESRVIEKRKHIKGITIYNRWFEVLICIVCMVLTQFMLRLPRGDTIVTFKVRMDN